MDLDVEYPASDLSSLANNLLASPNPSQGVGLWPHMTNFGFAFL